VLWDIVALITDFRVLVDFQTARCMIWSSSVLRGQETGFDGFKSDFLFAMLPLARIKCHCRESVRLRFGFVLSNFSMFFDLASVSTLRETVEMGDSISLCLSPL
jgi:hypothetical protein